MIILDVCLICGLILFNAFFIPSGKEISWKVTSPWERVPWSFHNLFLRISRLYFVLCFFLKDFWDIQIKACLKSGDFRAVVLDLQSYVRWNKNPLQSSFSWIQFYSSVGQKAARIACSVTEEKINFRIISTCIYVWVKTIPFYSHCSVFSGQILNVVPSLYQQVKVNFNVGQCAVP